MGKTGESGARRYVVSGRVQGVGFRYFVLRAAREFGVTGWVRNLADGSVEVHGQGDAAKLDALESCLREGPRLAAVRSVDVRDAVPERYTDFRIRD
jgi:acylphosphatase